MPRIAETTRAVADDEEQILEFGPFRVDATRRRLWRHGELVPVSSRAFDILLALARRAGRVVEKDELMRIVWPDTFVVDDNLSQQISALRKALGDHPEAPTYILTVPRRGYQLLAEVRNRPNGNQEPTPHPPVSVVPQPLDPVPRAPRIPNSTLIATTIAVVTLVAASAMVGISRKPAPALPQAVRFVETPPDGVNLESAGVVSPDGRTIVYVGSDSSGQTMLMHRQLDGVEARPLSGTEGASTPFWSPDSQSIGFFGENALKIVKLGGVTPSVRTLTLTYPARGGGRAGGTWSPNNVIVYAPSHVTELYAIPAGGGKARPITSLSAATRETAHLWPQFLPDGRHFLYTAVNRRREDSAVYLASLDDANRTLLVKGVNRAAFAPPGYLLFAHDGALMAQRFDPDSSRTSDAPRAVVTIPNLADVAVSASSNGILTYSGVSSAARELAWYDRSGSRVKTIPAAAVQAPALAPDQRRVAGEHQGEVWLVDLNDGRTSRFMVGPDTVSSPLWSPDGNRVAFASRVAIYVRDANESARKELLVDHLPKEPVLYDWSSDGRYIVYATRTPETQWDLWVLPMVGTHTPRRLLASEFTEYQARLSPDGHWIAYVSDESGTLEVYVDAFPSLGQKTRVSAEGGMHPTWRGDGNELFYLTPDHKVVAAAVVASSTFRVTATQMLFQTRITGVARNHYSVSSDGQRFLINSPTADPALSPITVVVNWPALLGSGVVYPTAP